MTNKKKQRSKPPAPACTLAPDHVHLLAPGGDLQQCKLNPAQPMGSPFLKLDELTYEEGNTYRLDAVSLAKIEEQYHSGVSLSKANDFASALLSHLASFTDVLSAQDVATYYTPALALYAAIADYLCTEMQCVSDEEATWLWTSAVVRAGLLLQDEAQVLVRSVKAGRDGGVDDGLQSIMENTRVFLSCLLYTSPSPRDS